MNKLLRDSYVAILALSGHTKMNTQQWRIDNQELLSSLRSAVAEAGDDQAVQDQSEIQASAVMRMYGAANRGAGLYQQHIGRANRCVVEPIVSHIRMEDDERGTGLYHQALMIARICKVDSSGGRDFCKFGTKWCVVEHVDDKPEFPLKYTQMADGRWEARRWPGYALGKTKAEARWNLEGNHTAPTPAGSNMPFMSVPMPEGWTE